MARPRDPAIDERALVATRKVLANEGYDGLSMARIAELSEASAPALYRRWPTVAHLAFDATLGVIAAAEQPDTGSFRGDLVASIEMFLGAVDDSHRRMLADRFGEMMANPAFAQRVYEESVEPATRTVATAVWERAVERGEVRSSVDGFTLFLDMAGILLHRHLMLDRRPTAQEIEALVDRTLHGVAAG